MLIVLSHVRTMVLVPPRVAADPVALLVRAVERLAILDIAVVTVARLAVGVTVFLPHSSAPLSAWSWENTSVLLWREDDLIQRHRPVERRTAGLIPSVVTFNPVVLNCPGTSPRRYWKWGKTLAALLIGIIFVMQLTVDLTYRSVAELLGVQSREVLLPGGVVTALRRGPRDMREPRDPRVRASVGRAEACARIAVHEPHKEV
jgi:hypothetical protein